MTFVRYLALLPLLVGCVANKVSTDVPALRQAADAASQRELGNVVSAALNGVDITLASDALMTSSTLILERQQRQSINRPRTSGRNLDRPDHFQLVLDARQCFLVHEETGLRWMLNETECVPE